MGKPIESFRDLKVYQLSFDLQQAVFRLSKRFPAEERYSLTDQVRRSSRSIGGNIAEAWHKRRYPSHFVSKLTDADAEQAETLHWLDTALACDYVDAEAHAELSVKYREVGAMLGKMMTMPESFCKQHATP